LQIYQFIHTHKHTNTYIHKYATFLYTHQTYQPNVAWHRMPHCGVVRHPFLQQIGSEGLYEDGGCSHVMCDRSHTRTTFACACMHAHILARACGCVCYHEYDGRDEQHKTQEQCQAAQAAIGSAAEQKNIAVSTHTAQI